MKNEELRVKNGNIKPMVWDLHSQFFILHSSFIVENVMLPREVIRQIRRLQIKARRAVEDLVGGEYHSVFKGMGIAFEEVREYHPGDDIRTIDWNVTAP